MSTRRYKFKVTSYEKLLAAFPKAVTSRIIPEHVEHKPVYEIIAKLLDCGLEVPGIELTSEEAAHDVNANAMGLGAAGKGKHVKGHAA